MNAKLSTNLNTNLNNNLNENSIGKPLKYFSKTDLDQRIKSLANQERELLHEILLTIKEIDQRKTYLALGYGNLFSYLTVGVGYSEGSAQRRIEAVRLLKEIPELGSQIQSGEVKLHHISMVQKAAREVLKSSKVKVSPEEKAQILNQISNQNQQTSQKAVAQFFDLPVLQTNTQKVQTDESIFVQIVIPKKLYAEIQQAQALTSHANPSPELLDYLEYVTRRIIREETSVRKFKARKAGAEVKPQSEVKTQSEVSVLKDSKNATVAAMAVENEMAASKLVAAQRKVKTSAPGFSKRTKKILRQTQSCCQYKDPLTQKQCQSTWFLQADHKHSLWAKGESSPENAQALCAAHNRMKYHVETNTLLQ